ncbi:hypothetical protein [Arcticibacter sp. MXS-1]|uniref:hypothetical protein n=1 Tax=Arcticibacter sp. MXS-1 TaxID=3341726 RepID=UPI0035A994B1
MEENLFDGLELNFKDLDPRIQEKALELAKQFIIEGHDRESAIKKAIALSEERFLDLEG